jgi:hypothetical protein
MFVMNIHVNLCVVNPCDQSLRFVSGIIGAIWESTFISDRENTSVNIRTDCLSTYYVQHGDFTARTYK